MTNRLSRYRRLVFVGLTAAVVTALAACGSDPEPIIQTVVVTQPGERVVETVVVTQPGERVVETVVVTQPGERIVEKVVVERIVEATAAPVKQSGTLRAGVSSITPGVFRPSLLLWPVNLDKVAWGVADPITYHPNQAPGLGDTTPEALAVSWTVESAGESVTFKLRQGVQFHDGWGELTADDVVYTFDDALFADGTLAKIAEESVWMDRWVKIDDYTVMVTTKPGEKLVPLWSRILSNNSQIGGIWSKKVFDDLGPDEAARTPVGTGPFMVEKWTANEQVILKAQESHFRQTPSIEGVNIREIPEEATRIAAFRAGEVDIIPVSLRFLPSVLGSTGAHAVETNAPTRQVIWFTGNHWVDTDLLTGDPVATRPGFKPDDDHPWIGDPDDAANFARAAKVRKAMALAIDRETINTAILGGLAQVGPNTWYNFSPSDPEYKPEWGNEFKFDPTAAKALLTEAGFPNGFDMDFFVTPDIPTIVNPQVGEAIAQMWSDHLGIDVKIDSTAYAAKRPSLVDRSFSGAYIWTYGSPGPDEPQIYNQRPILGSWNPGVEIDCADQVWFDIRAELDSSVRRASNAEAQQCLDDLRWNTIIAKLPIFAAVAKNVEWEPTTLPGVAVGDFEKVVIR